MYYISISHAGACSYMIRVCAGYVFPVRALISHAEHSVHLAGSSMVIPQDEVMYPSCATRRGAQHIKNIH